MSSLLVGVGYGAVVPTLSSTGPGCSGVDQHLVVSGVEGGQLCGGEGPAAAAQLGHLQEELLTGDGRGGEDQEGGPLVAVVAEAVRAPLADECVVTRVERRPGSRVVDGEPAGEHVEGLGEGLVEVRRSARAVRGHVVLDEAVPAGGDRA